MKKTLTFLLILSSIIGFSQTKPTDPGFKSLITPRAVTFWWDAANSDPWMQSSYLGIAPNTWVKLWTATKIQVKLDSLANAKQDTLTLTTTGTGSATLIGSTLNIPISSGTVPDSLKEDKANKENTTVDNSTTKYPTVNLLKTYADTKAPSSGSMNYIQNQYLEGQNADYYILGTAKSKNSIIGQKGYSGQPLLVRSSSGANAIKIIGRSDNLGYIEFYNNNETTLLGDIYGANDGLHFDGSVKINNLASTNSRLLSTSSTGQLTPIPDGTNGQVLGTDGNGVYSWVNQSGGTDISGKENISNKENTTVDNSTTKYPTVNLLKTYADTKEPVFSKNTAFNKNFGTTAGTVLEGRTFGTAANNNTSDFLLSSVNPYNSSVSFNSSTNNLSVVDAGGTKTANILVNTDLLINGFSGTINVTSNPVTFNWPVAYANTNYYLDIFPHYTETIEGKSVLIRNAVYDFTKTTTGFSLKLDTLAGVVEYRASRTINSETPANVVLQSDSITKFVTPKQLGDSLNTVVRTEVDPTIYAWAKSSTKPSYIASEVGAVPTTRTLTISGTTYDLSADRTWTVSGGTSTATGEIWTALTGTYATATTFTITGTDKDVGLLELSLLTCTNSDGSTRRIGYVKTATNSSGTITVNVVTDTDLASGDKDFKIAYNRKVTDYMRLVTIPGEQIADASYSQGMFYADIQSASYLLPVDLSVQTAAAGSGAALTVNIYKNTTVLFSSAPDMTTNTVLRSQRPTTNTISAAETVSLRIMSSAGATNKAANFQAKLYIIPQTIYLAF